jgi:hypothetical protein
VATLADNHPGLRVRLEFPALPQRALTPSTSSKHLS